MSEDSKLDKIKGLIDAAEASIRSAKQLLSEVSSSEFNEALARKAENIASFSPASEDDENDKIVEGVFNGQTMLDKDKKEYPVPANYASKSKLVPGDVLKLTIKEDGSFLYKQIGPVERKRIIGTLTYEDGEYKVIATGKAYKVILASVTYFKAEVGDKITLVVPGEGNSEWGAIENVLPQDAEETELF